MSKRYSKEEMASREQSHRSKKLNLNLISVSNQRISTPMLRLPCTKMKKQNRKKELLGMVPWRPKREDLLS
jgi:hypothetical protein